MSKLLVATPMRDSRCHGVYMGSMMELRSKISFDFMSITGSCFIDVARSELAEHFMSGDWTHLLFIDDDIGFDVEGVLKMLWYSKSKSDMSIIGAACPKRQLNWKKIKEAALAGEPEENFAFRGVDWNYNIPNAKTFNTGEPLEVNEIGTGIMAVQRKVFEKLDKPYFRTMHDGKEYIGEDVLFCRRWRESGGKVWMAPWVLTKHMGVMAYQGDIRLANLNY